ncbi:MAG: bifunctional diguanylate cyclase/phosphodiesterase [Mycobacterium sp.]
MRWRRGGWWSLARAQMWPGIRTPTLMARTGGACFLFGALVVTLLASLAPLSFHSTTVQYGNAAVAAFVGISVLFWGQRLRLWQFNAIVVVATLLISVSVHQAANPVITVSFATLYVFVACAAFFIAWPAAALQLTLAVACCMAAITASSSAPWWSGLAASGTTATIGIVIIVLGRIVATTELDDITGLPNRRGFDRMLNVAIGRAQSGGSGCAVAFICVDGYGAMREEFGGPAGDEMLQQIVTSWRAMLEPEQTLGRRGVDEFTVLLPGVTEQDAISFTQRMRSAAARSCSAGVTGWQPGESSSVTLARADMALRRAKRSGRNRTMVESANLPPLAVELRDALAGGAVNVHYQPIVNLASGDAVGVEALVRWTPWSHPDTGAAELIKVAEENNLIAALGQYVLRQACLDARWMQQRAPGLTLYLSVNVSGLELVQEDYAAQVFEVLAETGWAAQRLVLEVTESVLDVDRPSSIAALQEFRAGGVRIAIDDFGTGYSSLSRLHALPTDFLKLDASFIAAVTAPSPEVPPLLQAVAALADALNLPVVAEGVETIQQATVLRRLGFSLAQGFYFGRPQTREEVLGAMGFPAVDPQPSAVY